MNIAGASLLVGAGFLGGLANAMAGGASLFTFPALLASGLLPVTANASNAFALLPTATNMLRAAHPFPRSLP